MFDEIGDRNNTLEFGERIRGFIEEHNYLSQSLMVIYSHCGCLDKAYGVYKGLPDKNTVSWSTMISG